MKRFILFILPALFFIRANAQIDPELLRKPQHDTGSLKLNMDAVYDRPFKKAGKPP